MMRRRYWVVLACFVVLCEAGCAQQEPRYEVANYIGTLTLKEGSPDIDVELDVTYDVFEGVKSDGFKYVGTYEPSHLKGFDDAAKSVRVVLRRHRENQVYWVFPGVRSGKKRVVIQFTLHDVLTGTKAENLLSAPWIGIFKVSVRHAEYKIVFPGGVNPEIQSTTPNGFERTVVDGKIVLRLIQEPLTERAVSVRFAPGIFGAAREAAVLVGRSTSDA